MIHSLSNTLSYVIGVEKKNDDFRRYFHRSINKWDWCKAMIWQDKREHTRSAVMNIALEEGSLKLRVKLHACREKILSQPPKIVSTTIFPIPWPPLKKWQWQSWKVFKKKSSNRLWSPKDIEKQTLHSLSKTHKVNNKNPHKHSNNIPYKQQLF